MQAAELLERGQRLVAAGPHSPNTSEIAAVHAALYPKRDAVCQTCPGELGRAYYAIQRWVIQQENSSLTISTSNVKQETTARFHSDELTYTPHGLGIAYSNVNLTNKAARDILKADPDAAQHFAVLPPAEGEGENNQPLSPEQASAEKQAEQAQQPAAPSQVPAGFDYKALAAAMLDEVERRQAETEAKQKAQEDAATGQTDTQPNLTASAGGAAEAEDNEPEVKTEVVGGAEVTTGHTDGASEADHNDEQPVRLSRMNKEQLLSAYRTELHLEPAEGLTNDQLRDAIAEHRAAQQNAE